MRLPVIVEPLIVPIATIVIISSYQAQIVDILSAAIACGLEDKTVPIIVVLLVVLISVCVQKFPFSHQRCISLHSLLLRLLSLVKT